MKALILNSGIGKRLRPATLDKPKCLVEINGKTILGHEIENLMHYRIKDFIITTGPFSDMIKKFVTKNFPDLNVNYVNNPKYESTNYIYSMWLAKDKIDDDTILMHGDMVFEKELIGMLLNKTGKNCVLVNDKIEPPEKDFKGLIKNDIVTDINVNIDGKDTCFIAPIYKFSKDDFKIWLEEIEKFIDDGKVNIHAEDILKTISDKVLLYPAYYEDKFCMEIDDYEDLAKAQKLFDFNQ